MAWQIAPCPPGTYNWGAVTLRGQTGGFYFADFKGDHVVICPGEKRVELDQIALWDNSIEMPPNTTARAVADQPKQDIPAEPPPQRRR